MIDFSIHEVMAKEELFELLTGTTICLKAYSIKQITIKNYYINTFSSKYMYKPIANICVPKSHD